MKYFITTFGFAGFLCSCTSLPQPQIDNNSVGDAAAMKLLRQSSHKAGDPYQRLSKVDIGYDGKWAKLATKIQPVVTDPEFRKASLETYYPKQSKVRQIYQGPAGEKIVTRTPKTISVVRNGLKVTDQEELEAAALVADCYVLFTFGSSALLDRGSGWKVIGKRMLGGEQCTLIAGTVRPGFGMSDQDAVIAWIGDKTKRLHRIQLTLLGLASTAGADVDVTYTDFRPGSLGTEWPKSFVERIRRPFDIPAHFWWTESLKVRAR
ncbi:MAG: hypothetical protein AB8F34_09680 [Akkermansiaceae bacterium]